MAGTSCNRAATSPSSPAVAGGEQDRVMRRRVVVIVAIAAHPEDRERLCAGALAMASSWGAEVRLLLLAHRGPAWIGRSVEEYARCCSIVDRSPPRSSSPCSGRSSCLLRSVCYAPRPAGAGPAHGRRRPSADSYAARTWCWSQPNLRRHRHAPCACRAVRARLIARSYPWSGARPQVYGPGKAGLRAIRLRYRT